MRSPLLFLLGPCALALSCAHRSPGASAPASAPSAPTRRLEAIEVNGTKQFIFWSTRGHKNPILLFVHGGPGSTLMPFSRALDGDLLEHFTVVHWDQRGAGKSFSRAARQELLSLEQIAADGREITQAIRDRFGAAPIVLVGHSWGTIVAMEMVRQRPQDFRGLVLVGTVADVDAGDKEKLRYLDTKLNEDEQLRASRSTLPTPPFLSFESAMTVSGFLMKHGGILRGISPEKLGEAIRQNQEYSPAELEASEEALGVSVDQLIPTISKYRAIERQPQIAIPVCFVQGVWDMATPTHLAREYYDRVIAERGKTWSLFESSAHFPFYEEPARFSSTIRDWFVSLP